MSESQTTSQPDEQILLDNMYEFIRSMLHTPKVTVLNERADLLKRYRQIRHINQLVDRI
jgi:hypothetical protein